jgi:ATP-dependent 26S proteasome regulatory subunit
VTGAGEPWEALADGLLQREALLVRLGEGVPPRDLAGLFISSEDVERILRSLPGLDGPPPAAADPLRAELDEQLDRLRSTFAASLDTGSRFARLVRSAQLDREEAEVLALLAAVELHPQRQRTVAYVQDSIHLPRLTLAGLDRLFPEQHAGARRLSPGGRLRRAALVDLDQEGPWAVRMASLPVRVAWYLRGDDAPDPALPAGALLPDGDHRGDPPRDELVLVHGADRESRLQQAGERWPRVPLLVAGAPTTPEGWQAVTREATLRDVPVVLELDAPLDAAARAELERRRGRSWVLSSARELPLECLPRRPWVELPVRDATSRPGDWQAALGQPPSPGHQLDREQLRLVSTAVSRSGLTIAQGVRRLAAGHLDDLALRVTPRRGWDDLVLPGDQKQQLLELVVRYRQRTRVHGEWGFPALPSGGTVALFSGVSGTGKTLAAEVVAGELGLDLYKVDLSSVVSKYIGETEKNLGRIFEAAAAADLVLFFDEADALFGKRSEVSDAHDRYANIEVAYLLQRLETYEGLVVLATNLQRNIDPAFLRRISCVVEFALPEEAQRRAIWLRCFPATAPVRDLDLDFLARFKVTGGVIRNAALTAAFLAAEEGDVITMEHIAVALKREFQKLGRLRTEEEFDRYYELVNRDDHAAPAR